MVSKTFIAKSSAEIADQIKALEAEGFSPNLAIVFCSVNLDFKAVVSVFDQLGIEMVGASTAGEIVNDEVHDGIVTGLLFDVSRDCFGIFQADYDGKNPFKACKAAGEYAKQCFQKPTIMLMSGGVTIDAEQIVYGLKAGAGDEVPIFGGLAADDLLLSATFSFTHKGVSENGLAMLVFDDEKIEMKGLATSGWEGVGKENVITNSDGNIVYTINDEPAVNAFIKYFGYFNNDESKIEVSEISAQYPLQIMREDGTAVLRAPLMSLEENGALVLAGGVRNGDRFRFSIAPGFEVIDQTIAEFQDWKQATPDADALVLFSCKGRHSALGPLIEDEVKGIYDFWKKPMAGFFTYGEIGPTKNGTCEFHNETCSLVVIKARQ
jgi:hypothetical protein